MGGVAAFPGASLNAERERCSGASRMVSAGARACGHFVVWSRRIDGSKDAMSRCRLAARFEARAHPVRSLFVTCRLAAIGILPSTSGKPAPAQVLRAQIS